MGFEKMAAIFKDFKWLGVQISDPIQNVGPYYIRYSDPTVLSFKFRNGNFVLCLPDLAHTEKFSSQSGHLKQSKPVPNLFFHTKFYFLNYRAREDLNNRQVWYSGYGHLLA